MPPHCTAAVWTTKWLWTLSKTVNDGGSNKTSVLGCSEVIFRDAEKCRTSRHRTRKTSLHLQSGGNPLPMVADCEKPNWKINNQVKYMTMNNKKIKKPKPRGRPQVSTLKRLTKSVTVKFSKPDYEKLRHRSKNANRTLAEYIRYAAFDARIVAKHSTEDAAIIRNLTGMANNLNQLTKLSHQTGFYRTKNVVMELLAKLKEVENPV